MLWPPDRNQLAAAAGVGLLAGFLSGLFGVGGGILIVPGLVLLLEMDQRLAHGTSLGAILPIAAAGVVGYALEHDVDWSAGALIVLGAVVGAVIGARLLGRLPERTLRLSFAVCLVATAIRLLASTPSTSGRGPIDVWLALALVGIGLVSGTIAGILGVAAVVGLTGAGAAFGGSKVATVMSAHLSSILFAALLVAVAIRLLLTPARAGTPAA